MKARTVPIVLRAKIEQELNSLENRSDWATLIVSIHKPDGTVRLCGDFKVTLKII